jgi:hypothetical protein
MRMAFSYAWTLTVQALARSPRWPAEERDRALVAAGALISIPVVVGTTIPYVYWLVTGRGPWRSLGLSTSVVVNPFVNSSLPIMKETFAAMRESRASRP